MPEEASRGGQKNEAQELSHIPTSVFLSYVPEREHENKRT